MKLNALNLPMGDVSFYKEVPAQPETRHVQGGATYINHAIPGEPARFDVSFVCRADFEHEGIETSLFFTPHVPVVGLDASASYRDVEQAAADQLSAMFRALADQIDQQVAEVKRRDGGADQQV